MKSACPCHSQLAYEDCCAPLHKGVPAANAERLMRSRYSAYVLKNAGYLRDSWHASTRPDDLTTDSLQGTKWLGLTITNTHEDDDLTDHTAKVTFEARYRSGQSKTQTLKETSHFLLEGGHWFYVDGTIQEQ